MNITSAETLASVLGSSGYVKQNVKQKIANYERLINTGPPKITFISLHFTFSAYFGLLIRCPWVAGTKQ